MIGKLLEAAGHRLFHLLQWWLSIKACALQALPRRGRTDVVWGVHDVKMTHMMSGRVGHLLAAAQAR